MKLLILSQIVILFLAGCITTDSSMLNDTTQDNTLNNTSEIEEISVILTTTGSNCTETDDGMDYGTRGTTTSGRMRKLDLCQDGETLKEYSCNGNSIRTTLHDCSFGCTDGRCNPELTAFPLAIPNIVVVVSSCEDADGGRNYEVKGNITSITAYGIDRQNDSCSGSTMLWEKYCKSDKTIGTEFHTCTYGCTNGKCNPVTVTCIDTDDPTPGTADPDSHFEKGTATSRIGTSLLEEKMDDCFGSDRLLERYCKSNGSISTEIYTCIYGCADGKCNLAAPVCTDSDDTSPGTVSSATYTTKGTTTLTGASTQTDSCNSATGDITEWYCLTASTRNSIVYDCPNGCNSTADTCKPAPATLVCSDTDDPTPGVVNPGSYTTKGITSLTGQATKYDSCNDATGDITEWYCLTASTRSSFTYHCQYGCTSNQNYCNSAPNSCTDLDYGQITSVKASASDSTGASGTDFCVDSNTVKEYYCNAGLLANVNLDCPANNGCFDGRCQPICSDTDSGSYYEAGTTTFGTVSHADSCSGATLTEWYCGVDPFVAPTSVSVTCEYGCATGQCNPPLAASICTDSDDATPGAVDSSTYTVEGTTNLTGASTQTDSCNAATGEITEWYCPTTSTRASTSYTCTYGCTAANDYCNSAPPTPTCTDSDDGQTYDEKGTTTSTTASGTDSQMDVCSGDIVIEKYCNSDKSIGTENYNCAYGCINGECSPAPATPSLLVSYSTACEQNTVTVTSEGSAVSGAIVKVDGDSIGTTDSNGQIKFSDCGKDVIISASKSGHITDYLTATLVECSECTLQPECTLNSECNANEFCSNNECKQVTGTCGYISDHAWVLYQCCVNSDCSVNQKCEEHVCVQEIECISNSDCLDNSVCSDGSCKTLVGCGKIVNHTLAPYQCGTGVDCPVCPVGNCINHICFVGNVSCESGKVGEQKTCEFTQNQIPCSFCDYKMTDPDGGITTGKTGQDGKLNVSLSSAGVYKVALLKDGQVIKTTNIVATQRSFLDELVALIDMAKFICIPIVLLLIGGFVYLVLGHFAKKIKK